MAAVATNALNMAETVKPLSMPNKIVKNEKAMTRKRKTPAESNG